MKISKSQALMIGSMLLLVAFMGSFTLVLEDVTGPNFLRILIVAFVVGVGFQVWGRSKRS